MWYVYMIQCSDDSLYTGISTDVARRFEQHQQGKGAKYFRGRQALQLVYVEGGHDRRSASRREQAIKKLSKTAKWRLLVGKEGESMEGPTSL